MVSSADRLNYLFHYEAVPEMEGFDDYSRSDFVTGLHSDTRNKSLENYSERNPNSQVLDSASAAIIYDVEFEGQQIELRLEYEEDNIIGVDVGSSGKASEFVKQITDALKDKAEVKAKRKNPVAN